MSSPVLTQNSQIMCPHGGMATVTPSNQTVKAGGSPVLLVSDMHQVAGCPFTLPSGPNPCILIQWMAPAVSTRINQTPVLLNTSVGLCISATGAPQGTAQIISTQTEVKSI